MIPLCNLLGINVNELLSGEKISANEYQQKAEENMVTLIKEKEYVQTYNPLIWWIVYGPDFETAKNSDSQRRKVYAWKYLRIFLVTSVL